jgi:hypothetical protein
MLTHAQAERIEAGLGHGHWANQARVALRLLTASTGPTRAARRYDDDGGLEPDEEYRHLWAPKTFAEAESRRLIAAAARAGLSDDEVYERIFPGQS